MALSNAERQARYRAKRKAREVLREQLLASLIAGMKSPEAQTRFNEIVLGAPSPGSVINLGQEGELP